MKRELSSVDEAILKVSSSKKNLEQQKTEKKLTEKKLTEKKLTAKKPTEEKPPAAEEIITPNKDITVKSNHLRKLIEAKQERQKQLNRKE